MLPHTRQLTLDLGPAGSSYLHRGEILYVIRRQLLAVHGPQRIEMRLPPSWQFLNALLSSRTRDADSRAAFENLMGYEGSIRAIARRRPEEILELIHRVNHAETKAQQIHIALRMIDARVGDLSLTFLEDMSENQAMQWLMTLPGAGPKVAATTLNWSTLGKRVLAVDTHLLRVGKRMGLLSRRADYLRGFQEFNRLIPDDWDAEDLFEFHWLLKLHSQQICVDGQPACFRCPLKNVCPLGRSLSDQRH